MIFCEDCRVKKKWPKHSAHPYAGRVISQCQICDKIGECHDVPAIRLIPDADKTLHDKSLDKLIQEEFNRRCDSLVITHLNGHVDHLSSESLKQVFVKRDNQIDWQATYELRVEIQAGYRLKQQKKRDRS